MSEYVPIICYIVQFYRERSTVSKEMFPSLWDFGRKGMYCTARDLRKVQRMGYIILNDHDTITGILQPAFAVERRVRTGELFNPSVQNCGGVK